VTSPAPEEFSLEQELDVVNVRRAVRAAMCELGFGIVDQTKVVTATSELARNAMDYGGGGTVHVTPLVEGGRRGLRVAFVDHGPGIADVELALSDGYTTGRGLGLGLGGARRLVSDFDIVTHLGAGTTVTITHWR
jgi:serine/threonine-protein kinase RsbT